MKALNHLIINLISLQHLYDRCNHSFCNKIEIENFKTNLETSNMVYNQWYYVFYVLVSKKFHVQAFISIVVITRRVYLLEYLTKYFWIMIMIRFSMWIERNSFLLNLFSNRKIDSLNACNFHPLSLCSC